MPEKTGRQVPQVCPLKLPQLSHGSEHAAGSLIHGSMYSSPHPSQSPQPPHAGAATPVGPAQPAGPHASGPQHPSETRLSMLKIARPLRLKRRIGRHLSERDMDGGVLGSSA